MKIRNILAITLLGVTVLSQAAVKTRYSGGDISLLPEYDKSTYYSPSGTRVSDFLTYSVEQGMNCMRVRLFVNPENYKGSDKDANAKQDINYIIPICKRIKEAGSALMLDFHYSDTWADPIKQWTPADWVSLSDSELNQKIYDYTRESLQTLKANGIEPDFIQTGNEISYGMLWGAYDASISSLKKIHANNDANWSRFRSLLQNAVKACREECPEAAIVIHTERVAQPWYIETFHEKLGDLDYDIIGLSYYPYYHGNLEALEAALKATETKFPDKDIMIVETGYSYAWSVDNPVSEDYPLSPDGQNEFAKDLIDLLQKHEKCTGVFWWWMEYNPYGTTMSGWYNYPLVDGRNGKISPALATLASFAGETIVADPEPKPDPDQPSEYPDFYLLYNNGGDWELPGKKMTSEGEGLYTLTGIQITGKESDGGYGWFAMTTAYVTNSDWTTVNSNRYGPSVNDTEVAPGFKEGYEVAKGETSWKIADGIYNLTFDYNDMMLYVETYKEGDIETGIGSITGETEQKADLWFDLQGRRIKRPTMPGIYINAGKKVLIH